MDETQHCFVQWLSKVPKRAKSSRKSRLLTIQVEKGLKKGLRTYAATLMESKSDCVKGILDVVLKEVQKSTNVRPNDQQVDIAQGAQETHKATSKQMEGIA